ncbi:hypothetical protein AMTRI_Chr09g15860 [Amborella trichopoda]
MTIYVIFFFTFLFSFVPRITNQLQCDLKAHPKPVAPFKTLPLLPLCSFLF